MKSKETRKMLRNVRRKTALVLTPAALLVALAGLVLPVLAVRPGASRADSAPFDGSSVASTADEVRVGEAMGFALYLVNSSLVTATDVLVWNPLPPGSTYVSASGGAFPVVGGAVSDALPIVPPEGHAYDARLHTSIPLTGTDEVSGVAWVGSLPPGEMVALGLIVTVDDPAGRFLVDEMLVYDDRELAGQFFGQAWVPPYSYYLPLVSSPFESPTPTPMPTPTEAVTYQVCRGFLVQNVRMRSLAQSYEQAVAGPPDYVQDGGNQYSAHVYHPNPGDPWTANRDFLRYDLPEVDASLVLSSALVLYPAIANTEPGTATFRCGTWTGTPDAGDWDAFGEPLVTFRPLDLGWTWPYTLPIAWDDLLACNGQLALVVDEAAAPDLPPGTKLYAGFVDGASHDEVQPQPWDSHVWLTVRQESNP